MLHLFFVLPKPRRPTELEKETKTDPGSSVKQAGREEVVRCCFKQGSLTHLKSNVLNHITTNILGVTAECPIRCVLCHQFLQEKKVESFYCADRCMFRVTLF